MRASPLFAVLVLTLIALAPASVVARTIDYTRDVQPLLSENCYQCHGPDSKAREADLRLDRREGLFESGKHGFIPVVPDAPEESELILRIFSTDSEEVMPHPESNRALTPAQREILRQWVEQGAPWEEHWAYTAIRRPPPPTTPSDKSKPVNPIDAFVRARLAAEGLVHSPRAPPKKLIRRVSLDLMGLPPSLGEIDRFLSDSSPTAYAAVVDRLLASPRYGERMVWEWLDAARYADTNGFQSDPTRTMWPWRDWVIGAFNENMPFDRFTIEQLAGDLLPNATQSQKLATGFNRNHMLNNEGGSIPEESRIGYVMDRVETTATVWMGMTLTCARCHDHKYDPISQHEYYQLAAFFNQVPEKGNADANPMALPLLSLATAEDKARVDRLRQKAKTDDAERAAIEARLVAGQEDWEDEICRRGFRRPKVSWHIIRPTDVVSVKGARLEVQADDSVLASGRNPAGDEFIVSGVIGLRGATALRLEALPDPSLPRSGPGRADNGGFVLADLIVQTAGRPVDAVPIGLDIPNGERELQHLLDNNPATSWSAPAGRGYEMVVELKNPPRSEDGLLLIRLGHGSDPGQRALGRFRLAVTNAPVAVLRATNTSLAATIGRAANERSPTEKRELRELMFALSSEYNAARHRAEGARRAADKADQSLLKVMIMQDRAESRDTFVLERGSYDQPRGKVSPGTPAFLQDLADDGVPDRLALARWLVAPDHPLTARVTVNRIWAQFFGQGLVKTAEDFGRQGEKPSHPDLLDWLAGSLVDSGWNVKQLVRLIVTSETYRQSSVVSPETLEQDPENRLLARGARFRLPSWMIRDQALAASGRLVEKIGGPGVRGYQPPGIWEEATFGKIRYEQDEGEALYRRSVYQFWRRIVGPTVFFDTASRQVCSVNPSRTNTPLHALTTLNDVTYVEAARLLAERLLTEAGADDDARVALGFRLCTARDPTVDEMATLVGALKRLRREFAAAPQKARSLIATGDSIPAPALPVVELAAHTALASVLLNLDETLNRE